MSETTLFAAEAAVVALMLVFVWMVVRSSSRSLRDLDLVSRAPAGDDAAVQRVVPRPPPAEVEAIIGGAAPVAATASAGATAPTPAPAELPRIDLPSSTPPAADTSQHPIVSEDELQEAGFEDGERGPMDLSVNIRPRLLIESSPVLAEGTEVELEGGITIGRSRSSQLCIEDAFVSHMHARVFRRGPFFHIEDLGSTNGSFLNGRRIEGTAQLKVHDELRLGETVLRYEE